MNILTLFLFVMYLFPFETNAQFRILGLLNLDDSKAEGSTILNTYQSNARGRGFSVNDGLKKFLIRPKNIIRVHVIGDVEDSDLIPVDKILMIQKVQPQAQWTTNSIQNEPIDQKITTTTTEKIPYHTKRPKYQPRTLSQLKKQKYQVKSNDVFPEASNLIPVHAKFHTKRNRYKSRCRCELLSNCPRIQLSVSRCEPNHFLCCF